MPPFSSVAFGQHQWCVFTIMNSFELPPGYFTAVTVLSGAITPERMSASRTSVTLVAYSM